VPRVELPLIAHVLEHPQAGRAELVIAEHPIGPELRLLHDGDLSWSRACRTGEELRTELAAALERLQAEGWVLLPEHAS